MDSAFKSRPFAGHTTQDLRDRASGAPEGIRRQMEAEIARRERAAAGDMSVMTDGERLRFVRANPTARA